MSRSGIWCKKCDNSEFFSFRPEHIFSAIYALNTSAVILSTVNTQDLEGNFQDLGFQQKTVQDL